MKSLTWQKYPMLAAIIVMVAVGISGCSDDDVVMSVASQQADTAIGFVPVVNRATTGSTRHVSLVTENNFNEFDVWAFKADEGSDEGFVMGVDASKGVRIEKSSDIGLITTITGSDNPAGLWGYASVHQIGYWPEKTQTLQFYALSPAPSRQMADGLAPVMDKANHAFTYEPGEKETGTSSVSGATLTDHSMQRDLIVSAKTVALDDVNKREGYQIEGDSKTYPRLSIPLTFKHALSHITFDAKLEPGFANMEVTLYSISICNVYKKGTCVIGSDGTPAWPAEKLASKGNYTVTFNGGNGVTLSTSSGNDGHALEENIVALSSSEAAGYNDNLMVVPQEVKPWKPDDNPNVTSPSQSGAYLKIRCKIKQNGYNLLSTEQEKICDIYTPFTGVYHGKSDVWGSWEAGNKYCYTLIFGLGYDEIGSLNGYPIRFTVTTTDWATGTVTNPSL